MTERVAITSIRVGERRRQDLGDIAGLARNIDQHGLLHPLIIAADDELIAGERRLRACQSLGWNDIDVRRWPDLSEPERRELELAENLNRKDLTPAERSRQMVALAAVAAEVDQDEFRPESGRNGRPDEPGSLRRVSERTGIPRSTLNDATRHVAAIDAYPELTPFAQTDALKIAGKLDAMPEPERVEARSRILANDADTLTTLTERPPMPSGPSPREQAAKDPAVRFQADLHDLWKRLNGVRDHGGIGRVIAHWPANQKVELLTETERIAELMGEWSAEIKEQLA